MFSSTSASRRRTLGGSLFVVLFLFSLLLAACGSTTTTGGGNGTTSNALPCTSPTTGGSTPGATATSSTGSATITAPNDLITSGTLTVGSDTTYPPQEYIDTSTGKPVGFDIDLITAIAQRIGLKTKVISADFGTIIDSLKAKRFDVVISAVTINPQRQQQVDFVPYFYAGESLLVQKGNPMGLKCIANLCGLNVGVQKGTVEQDDLTAQDKTCKAKGKPGINMTILQNQTDVVQLLATNRVVATYQDSPVTDYYLKQNPGQFDVGGTVVNAADEGIVVRKGDTSMFNAVSAAFAQLKSDGTYHTLITKWGLTSGEIS